MWERDPEGGLPVRSRRNRRLLLGALACGAVASTAFPHALFADWTTYQANPRHDGRVEALLDPSQLAHLWTVPLSTERLNRPAAAEGRVFVSLWTYFGTETQFYAFDGETGEVLWSKYFGSVYSVNDPAYADGKVYVQTGKGTSSNPPPLLRVFHAETGALAFQQQFDAQWERYFSPTVVDGVVYANAGAFGGLFAFDAAAPGIHWSCPLNHYDEWSASVDDSFVYAYTGEYEPRLSVIDRVTGLEVRSIEDPDFVWSGWSMSQAPALGTLDDAVVVQSGRLVVFDLITDQIRYQLPGPYFAGQPAVADQQIFVLASGSLSVWKESIGEFGWAWAPDDESLTSNLIVTDRHVIVGSATTTYLIDRTTHEVVGSAPYSGHLAWSDDRLYIAGGDGAFTALRLPSLLVFRDGFESGDARAWSGYEPVP